VSYGSCGGPPPVIRSTDPHSTWRENDTKFKSPSSTRRASQRATALRTRQLIAFGKEVLYRKEMCHAKTSLAVNIDYLRSGCLNFAIFAWWGREKPHMFRLSLSIGRKRSPILKEDGKRRVGGIFPAYTFTKVTCSGGDRVLE